MIIKEDCKIEITDKYIVCKKVVINRGWMWESLFMNTRHDYDKELQGPEHLIIEPIKFQLGRGEKSPGIVNIGFHAFLESEESLIKNAMIWNRMIALIKWHSLVNHMSEFLEKYVVIPPGSEYCLGKWNEIVANRMIVFSSDEKFEEYKIYNE